MTGYGPQENWSDSERMPFFMTLEAEIVKAEIEGKSIIIELDANSKLGPHMIPGDMHPQSENGKCLTTIIARHGLTIGNSMVQCKGLITRQRVTKNKVEQSIIDFVLISADLKDDIESIVIDEAREHVLTRITKTKRGVKKVESDHNVILTHLKLAWSRKLKEKRIEMFNLKNSDCQKKFKEATSSEYNGNYLSEVFDENDDLNILAEKFMKRLNKTINKCFRKVRITNKMDKEKEEIFARWRVLKSKTDNKSKIELEKTEKELADKYAEEYFEKINKKTAGIDDEEGGMNSGSLWSLKKEIFPKSRDPPTAMVDPETGNLLTTEDKIENAALNCYKKRLENRPIRDDLSHIKEAKEMLSEKLLEVARSRKTPPWSMKDLDIVLKNLKKQKSRDPHGLANDLFLPDVAGDDLKLAVLKLMNEIKEKQVFPKCLELCNISSIWKKKGNKNNFNSYRGIFRVTIFRSILDKLIYNDEYNNIDKNLTDANVGARKKRNIRDNIFVLNAITNSKKKEKAEALDLQVYDIEKCFDALWLHEVINCLFESGLQNDKLPLLFLENNNAQVAIKSNGRISKRISIKDIILQGSVWGSLCCVVLMNKLGKLAYSNPELLYYYKGVVGTPPLQMVDDILAVQRCSSKSLKINTAINTFIDLEKLTLSKSKCHNIHVGSKVRNCPSLKVQEKKMENSKKETYLGDIIDESGTNKANIEKRKQKGYGIISEILAIINEIPLGKWKIEAGLKLRQAMLINGTLFNTEAWHNVSNKDTMVLEKVDEAFLRGLLQAHPKIPLEALYLETKSLPIRFILASRRILYLHNILQKESNELVRKIYDVQKLNPSTGDFTELVKEDMSSIGLGLTEDEISKIPKQRFKKLVKQKIYDKAFLYLKDLKDGHSKMQNMEYGAFEVASYLKSSLFNSSDISLLLALRTRTVRGIRSDFGGLYSDKMCPLGCGDTDTLQNVLTCKILTQQHVTQDITQSDVRYADIFSSDIRKQKQVTELYQQLLQIRDNILQSFPVTETGPVHSVHALQKLCLI